MAVQPTLLPRQCEAVSEFHIEYNRLYKLLWLFKHAILSFYRYKSEPSYPAKPSVVNSQQKMKIILLFSVIAMATMVSAKSIATFQADIYAGKVKL